MAGKPKQGLDYAGWATNIFDGDTKIDRLLDAQGWVGFSIYFYLCQMAYKFDGYFYRWSYADAATTARRMGGGVKSETVKAAVGACLQIGLFDKRLFEENAILTSRGIQRRFFAAIKDKRRKAVITDYWLLEEEEQTEGLEKCVALEQDCSKDGNVCNKDEEKCRKDDPERKEKKKKENEREENNTPLTPRRQAPTGSRQAPTGILRSPGDDISLSDGANGPLRKGPRRSSTEEEINTELIRATPPGACLAGACLAELSTELAVKVQEWLQYKRERREPYKPTGLKSLLSTIQKQAEQYGDQAVMELIDQCMAANYRGIIWDKLQKNRTSGPSHGSGQPDRQQPISFSEIAEKMERGELF